MLWQQQKHATLGAVIGSSGEVKEELCLPAVLFQASSAHCPVPSVWSLGLLFYLWEFAWGKIANPFILCWVWCCFTSCWLTICHLRPAGTSEGQDARLVKASQKFSFCCPVMASCWVYYIVLYTNQIPDPGQAHSWLHSCSVLKWKQLHRGTSTLL